MRHYQTRAQWKKRNDVAGRTRTAYLAYTRRVEDVAFLFGRMPDENHCNVIGRDVIDGDYEDDWDGLGRIVVGRCETCNCLITLNDGYNGLHPPIDCARFAAAVGALAQGLEPAENDLPELHVLGVRLTWVPNGYRLIDGPTGSTHEMPWAPAWALALARCMDGTPHARHELARRLADDPFAAQFARTHGVEKLLADQVQLERRIAP